MIRVTRLAIIDAPIERVWAILRAFNSHGAWHPVVAESAIENVLDHGVTPIVDCMSIQAGLPPDRFLGLHTAQ